jgi:radical SAM-linked protein
MSDVAAYRLRISYGKLGRLRFLSHLELTRAVERLIRRSGLPCLYSNGFNVHMRHAFAPALPVGVAGRAELMDIWLSERLPAEAALEALQGAAMPELPVNGACYLGKDAPSIQASHVYSSYEAQLYAPGLPSGAAAEAFLEAFASILAQGSIEIVKKGKPKTMEFGDQIAQAPKAWQLSDTEMRDWPDVAPQGAAGLGLVLKAGQGASVRADHLMHELTRRVDGARLLALTRVAILEALPAIAASGS